MKTATRLKILIIDNQPRARNSARALLSTWPHVGEVREASNGREALDMMDEFRPDVVLTDVRMPEMDGLAATRAIKARWPQVKVIVLSMYLEHRNEALAAGANAFVTKGEAPVKLLDLLSAVVQEARA